MHPSARCGSSATTAARPWQSASLPSRGVATTPSSSSSSKGSAPGASATTTARRPRHWLGWSTPATGRPPSSARSDSTNRKPCDRLLAPALRALDLVEGEDMQSGDAVVGPAEVRGEPLQQALRAVGARKQQPPSPAAVAPQEARGVAKTDAPGHPQELSGSHRPRQADVNGQLDAAVADAPDPRAYDLRREADLTDDVRRQRRLVEHRLDRRLVADEGMALGIAGDADLLERMPGLGHGGQQRRGSLELARGLSDVAGHDENLAKAELVEARKQLVQMAAVDDQPGRQVWDDAVAVRREALAERERGVDAPRRRGRHGDRQLRWDVADHLLLDAVERHHLQARTPEEVDEHLVSVDHCPVTSRCLGISFLGSMNGISTTTASRRSPSTSTSSSVPSSASSIGTIA